MLLALTRQKIYSVPLIGEKPEVIAKLDSFLQNFPYLMKKLSRSHQEQAQKSFRDLSVFLMQKAESSELQNKFRLQRKIESLVTLMNAHSSEGI